MKKTLDTPGQRPIILSDEDNPDNPDHSGGYMAVIASAPEWVRVPSHPELFGEEAGQKLRVLQQTASPCPCGCDHDVITLRLERRLVVFECPATGYLWAHVPTALEVN